MKKRRKKKQNKNNKTLKIIRIISLVCVFILCLEFSYLVIRHYFNNNKKQYFNGTNDYIYVDNNYITIGSDNNNDKMLEKAKISKYNEKKEEEWTEIYNKSNTSSYLGVDIDNEDNILVVGNYTNKKNSKKALLIKYNKDGEVLLEKNYKELDNTEFTNIKVVEDGYIVTGTTIYDEKTLGNKPGGALLIKYDKEGKLVWKQNFGNNKNAIYNDLLVYNNYIYTVGKYSNNVGIVSKYSLDGELISYETFNNIDEFGFTGITINNDNLVISGGKVNNSSNTDGVLIKLDLDCDYIDQVLYKEKTKDRFNKVITDSYNNIVVIGSRAVNNKRNIYNYKGLIGKYKSNLKKIDVIEYGDNKDDHFTQIREVNNNYLVSGYSLYKEEGYLSKFITYSDALKVLEVR
ncbi:MAG: hypothetical protein IJF92_03205 [Bacilli bacterium]|nr:hypothetical protein [Bacilli bacterium]